MVGVDEALFLRRLRLVAVETAADLRRELVAQVEAIAEYERAHPAINWPIDRGKIDLMHLFARH